MHQHVHEQTTYIVSGQLDMNIGRYTIFINTRNGTCYSFQYAT